MKKRAIAFQYFFCLQFKLSKSEKKAFLFCLFDIKYLLPKNMHTPIIIRTMNTNSFVWTKAGIVNCKSFLEIENIAIRK